MRFRVPPQIRQAVLPRHNVPLCRRLQICCPITPQADLNFNGFRIRLIGNDAPNGIDVVGDKSCATWSYRQGHAFPEDSGGIGCPDCENTLAPSNSVGNTHRDSDKIDPSCSGYKHFPRLGHRLVPVPEFRSLNKSQALLYKLLPARPF